ncbi:MAG: cyclic nucleotide-binding domain-containing protein [Chloroflexi bacterium]|nr:cyclic nucleotide-binding domain-containing protein [Chloroflexota bacterium]
MTTTEIIECLKSSELFASLTENEIKRLIASLASACKVEEYGAGENVFVQGEKNFNRVYIIEDGQVLMQRSLNIGNRTAMWPLGILHKGGTMGWSSLLYGPHLSTATATCQKPTRVISLEAAALLLLLRKEPVTGFKVMERLAYMLGNRLRTAISTMEAHL